jgi:hypothetical protein
MNKLKRMGLAGHVSCTEELKNTHKILVGRPEQKRSLWKRIILKWTLKKYSIRVWCGFI